MTSIAFEAQCGRGARTSRTSERPRTLHQRLIDDQAKDQGEDEPPFEMPTLCGSPDDVILCGDPDVDDLGKDGRQHGSAVRAAVRAQANGNGMRTFERTFGDHTFEPKLPPGASVHTSPTRRVHQRRIVDHASDKDEPFPPLCGNPDDLDLDLDLDEPLSAMPTLCANLDDLDLGADGSVNDSAAVDLDFSPISGGDEKKPMLKTEQLIASGAMSENDIIIALREQFHQTEFKRDQLLDELAELDQVHQSESLEEQDDHYTSISKVHLDSELSKAVVPDSFKSRHTLNRERKNQLLDDYAKVEKKIAELQACIDAIAPPPSNIFDIGQYFTITG